MKHKREESSERCNLRRFHLLSLFEDKSYYRHFRILEANRLQRDRFICWVSQVYQDSLTFYILAKD